MSENSGDPIKKAKPTSNPYRHAAYSVFNRLKWDLTSYSWNSRSKLTKMKNKYKGEKCVILCNGPSLNKVDFDILKKVHTIGLNKVNLLFDRTDFRPTVIAAVNPLVIEQNADFFNETSIPLFIDSVGTKFIKDRKNVSFLHSSAQVKFSTDISMSIWQGATVTFVALQLAFHLGFSEVALVGCDHNFSVKGPSNKEVTSETEDTSHFDPNYFGKGVKWQLPDLNTSEFAYGIARETYEAYNIPLYNCTEGGKLEIFERKTLADFING